MKLIYTGRKVYQDSMTWKWSLYDEKGAGLDWEAVQALLEKGESIEIRPLTSEERLSYEERLHRIVHRQNEVLPTL